MFQTIQGEASFAGRPAVFVRLQGCAVGCPWCDTRYTWPLAHAPGEPEAVFERQNQPGGFEWEPGALLAEMSRRFVARHLVLTGGEPAAQPLGDFCTRALLADWRVQIETSGTYELNVPGDVFVTVSPKLGMPGGRAVLVAALGRANEIKMPVGKRADIDQLEAMLPSIRTDNIWLQPLSQSAKATELCLAACIANNWRLSLQLHKFIGIA